MDTKVRKLIKDQKLVTLSSNANVYNALQTLAQHNILSAPIMTEEEGGEVGKVQRCLGLVDVLDILAFLVHVCTKPIATSDAGESPVSKCDQSPMLRKRSHDFILHSVRDLMNLSQRNPYVTVTSDDTAKSCLKLFRENRLHRMVVLDKTNGEVVGVITQRDVFKFLLNRNLLPPIESVRPAGALVPIHLAMVTSTTRAIDAFITMHKDQLSSFPITDPTTGKLHSVITASDVKTLSTEEDFKLLNDEVGKFVVYSRAKQGREMTYLGVCSATTPAKEALKLMLRDKVHRLFVVDQEENPIGVLSLTDLLF